MVGPGLGGSSHVVAAARAHGPDGARFVDRVPTPQARDSFAAWLLIHRLRPDGSIV